MKPVGDSAVIRRVWREHTRKYLSTLIGVIALTVLIAAMEAYSVSLLKPIFDEGFISSDYTILLGLCLQVVVIYFAKGWFSYAHSLVLNHVTTKTIQSIQHRVFAHLMQLDMRFFSKTSSGHMLSRIMSDCNAIASIAINFITNVFRDLITCIAMFSLMVYYSWQLVLVVLIFVPIGAIAMKNINKKVKHISQESASLSSTLFSKISESLQSIKIIKSYNMESRENENLRSIFDTLFSLSKRRARATAFVTPLTEMLSGLILAGILIFGGYQIAHAELTTGGFVTFLGAWVAMYRPLKSLLNFRTQLQTALVHAARVYEIIDTKPQIVDRADAKRLAAVKGEIEFRDLSFEYNEGRRVLNAVNIVVKAGQTVALVGASGGGKSTLVSLVPRFFDPSGGAVLIDGADIRNYTQSSLRDQIAYVSQEVILFDDTIAANIAYGRGQGAAPSETEIRQAAKSAYADRFIEALPEGYQTIIGEKGVRLSGGQKQRLSIARAIIKNAPILLLDEATSALDTEAEREVQAALETLMQNRTTIVIAHRLSTIVNADQICVLMGGEVVERGTHKELLGLGNEYAKLYAMQFSDQER
ncbi:ABC transporter ATP-binding protein [Campylobacterota bacterium]|nr:ABC transporter ATP-binding protein [Campylobacterota bacterium]